MTGPKDVKDINDTIAAPDDLLKVGKDAEIELSEAQLKDVTGGRGLYHKAIDKTDDRG